MTKYPTKIIHIMTHPPAYDEYADKPRPTINWDTANGSWVGIWGYDWGDQICIELAKVTEKFELEVWQPDLRADKIYSAELYNKVRHIMFPCNEVTVFKGLKRVKECFSSKMLERLNQYQLNFTKILIITNLEKNKLNIEINKLNVPIIFSFLGLPDNLFRIAFSLNPLKLISRFINNLDQISFLRTISYVQIGDFLPRGEERIRKFLNAEIITSLIGLDLKTYSKIEKVKARDGLRLDQKSKILFTSSRLVDLKQIDKLIQVCAKLYNSEFQLIISGHGTKQYQDYLNKLVIENNLTDKVSLVGYQDEKTLIQYYCASDLFINVSKNDGGPMSAWKALALGIPVMNSSIGNVYHFLESQKAGIIVPPNNYSVWEEAIEEFLSGKIKPIIADPFIVRNLLLWSRISSNSIKKYESIINDYYKQK